MVEANCWLSGPESDCNDSGVRGGLSEYGWHGPGKAAQCIECRLWRQGLEGRESRDKREKLGGGGGG